MVDVGAAGAAIVIAAGLVPVISLVKRPEWTDRVKYLVGMVAAIVASVAGAVIDGAASTATPAEWVLLVFTALGASQTLYQTYFKNTAVNESLSER